MSPIRCHQELWPLVLIDIPVRFSVEELATFSATINALYAKGGRFATLVDSRAISSVPDAAVRKRLGDWQNETRALIAKHNVFTATVIESPMVRGAMTAINWIFRPPNEQVVVGRYDEGFRRCLAALLSDGITFPPELERIAQGTHPSDSTDLLRRTKAS